LSNVRLRAVPSLAEHPLPRMLDAGLVVCLNSDDPAYFGGYLDQVVASVQAQWGFTAEQLTTLSRNSIEASFLPEAEKRRLLAEGRRVPLVE
jgi:adenosine deaminase